MEKKIVIIVLVSIVATAFLFRSALAVVSSSNSYSIGADSLNFIGGTASSSDYQLWETGGETSPGGSFSNNYILTAGYQRMTYGGISVDLPSSSTVVLTPNIDVQTGGQSNGSLSWSITTSGGGYYANLKKDSSFAGQYGVVDPFYRQFISDYYEDITYGWSVPDGYSVFGFSPEGDDIIDAYHDDGNSCGSGSGLGNCWQGPGDVDDDEGHNWPDRSIALSTSPVTDSEFTLNFRLEIAAGTYLADEFEIDITITFFSL